MDLVATAVFTFARDVGLVPWSGGSAGPDLHIGTLLNGAWDGFFSDPAAFAAKYAQWREKFNARDDGRAAERVVGRILDQRLVDAD